jgi:hypothetical protein
MQATLKLIQKYKISYNWLHAQTFTSFHLHCVLRDPHSPSLLHCLPDRLRGNVRVPPDHPSAEWCTSPNHSHEDSLRVKRQDRTKHIGNILCHQTLDQQTLLCRSIQWNSVYLGYHYSIYYCQFNYLSLSLSLSPPFPLSPSLCL